MHATPPPASGPSAGTGLSTTPVRKAVILARGLGTRMRRADASAALDAAQERVAAAGVKAMIDVGRPFLDYSLSALADAGVDQVCLVIGPEHDVLRDYARRTTGGRLRVTCTVQTEPRGTADAAAAAREFAGEDRVIVLNSDNHYPASVLRALVAAPGAALVGFDREALVARSNIPAERIRAFALIEQDERGHLVGLVEKPTDAQITASGSGARVSMNAWLLTPPALCACADVTPSVRGELELVDAVLLARERGEEFTVVPAAEGVLDLSSRGDIAAVRQALADVPVAL